MIISRVRAVDTLDVQQFWASLRRFRNLDFTTDAIVWVQQVEERQIKNVKKQAQQIGFCLEQAEQYFLAAGTSTMATRPLLQYYGLMSFALAEILLKNDGQSSLDYARGQHAHHGLDFKLTGSPHKNRDISISASQLSATPLIRAGGERFGTFELWHRGARKWPAVGTRTNKGPKGTTRTTDVILSPDDRRMPVMDRNGISLLDCLTSMPTIASRLSDYGLSPELAHASARIGIDLQTGTHDIAIVVHPERQEVLDAVAEQFLFPASLGECVTTHEYEKGWGLNFIFHAEWPLVSFETPQSMQIDSREIYFPSIMTSLNEFGVFYVALFILGSYARYYPDYWMVELEKNTPLALMAEEMTHAAQSRIPALILSELQRSAICLAKDPI